ncbi:MAG: Cbp1 family collagen-binding glycoprotein adhesin [Bacteroidia bacterium]
MKKIICFAFSAMLLFTACSNDTDSTSKVYEARYDSLNSIVAERDSAINNFLASFNDIERNLDSVAMKQNVITLNVEKNRGEIKNNTRERINSQIAAINNLMEQNKKKIDELSRKVKRYSLKISQFDKMINTLNDEIAQKNNELQSLNEQLNAANAQVAQLQTSLDTMSSMSSSQLKLIASQTESMHTAFYLVGKSKELEEKKIIDKTGGLLGIGKTSRLNSEIDPGNFTKIDYTKVQSIPINSRKAKLVTTHPSDSYTWNKENDQITALTITQPEKFWSASKYLVVVN